MLRPVTELRRLYREAGVLEVAQLWLTVAPARRPRTPISRSNISATTWCCTTAHTLSGATRKEHQSLLEASESDLRSSPTSPDAAKAAQLRAGAFHSLQWLQR